MTRRLLPLAIVVMAAIPPSAAAKHPRIRLLSSIPATAIRAHAATTLVTMTGQPIGGQMQRWADEAQVATVPGRVVVVDPSGFCVADAESCSGGAPWHGTSSMIGANTRDGLYFELGHLFDWHYLTWPQRKWLAHQWGRWGTHWITSDFAIRQGTEDGLEGAFAAIYEDCAFNRHVEIGGILLMEPPKATVKAASAEPRTDASTCAFIARAAARRS